MFRKFQMLTTVLSSHLLGCEAVSLGEWVQTFRMDHTAFVFRIKQQKESNSIPNLLRLLDPEVTIIRSSATSGTTRPTIQSHIQEDLNFRSHLSNTIPCPQPDASSPNLRTLLVEGEVWYFSSFTLKFYMFTGQNFIYIPDFSHTCYMTLTIWLSLIKRENPYENFSTHLLVPPSLFQMLS